ncbi:hypothetical protein LNQ52_22600 [Klebsiella pneumoniae subsp. pneumoniae]|nr:hypothetical protein [Klebsiella pneumoniae subsp. pneumoniae]
MHAYLHCLSPTPRWWDSWTRSRRSLDEVNGGDCRRPAAGSLNSIQSWWCSSPRSLQRFFYDVMPPFCLGVGATAIGDFASAAGDLPVPRRAGGSLRPRHPQQRYRPGGVVQHAGGPWLRPAAGVSAGWPGPRAGAAGVY